MLLLYKLKSSLYSDMLQLVSLRVSFFLSMLYERFRRLLRELLEVSSHDPKKIQWLTLKECFELFQQTRRLGGNKNKRLKIEDCKIKRNPVNYGVLIFVDSNSNIP